MFIPTVYASQVLTQLRANLVGLSVSNQNYTGEIKQAGNTVRVYAPGALVVNPHVQGAPIAYQAPGGAELVMLINQQDDCSFIIDDIDTFQSATDVQSAYARVQGAALASAADTFILGQVANALPANLINGGAIVDGPTMIAAVRTAKINLSNQNVPRTGRYLVVSPAYAGFLSDYVQTTTGDMETVRAGWVGRVEGFDVYETTGLPVAGGNVSLMYGHSEAITFASQIVNAEFIPSHPDYHGAAFKGLHVYGANVFLPAALGEINAPNI